MFPFQAAVEELPAVQYPLPLPVPEGYIWFGNPSVSSGIVLHNILLCLHRGSGQRGVCQRVGTGGRRGICLLGCAAGEQHAHGIFLGAAVSIWGGLPGVFCVIVQLGIVPYVVLRTGFFDHFARAQDGFPIGLMVGKAQSGAVQAGDFDLFFSQRFPGTVVFRGRPEGMIPRQMQTQKGFPQPERGFRAGVALHQREKLPVKSKGGNALVEEIFPSQELQQGA